MYVLGLRGFKAQDAYLSCLGDSEFRAQHLPIKGNVLISGILKSQVA